MAVTSNNGIKIGCWNIQGMKEHELDDDTFVNFLNQNDCTSLLETWCSNVIIPKNFNLYCLPSCGSKHGRAKGGIVVVMKNSIHKGIKIHVIKSVKSNIFCFN